MKRIEGILELLKMFDYENSKNIVIGGTTALKLHGLNLPTEPEDIDVVIYKPTDKQKQILKILSLVSEKNNTNKYIRRSYKIKTSDETVDILVESDKDVPDNLLYCKHGIMIQSVENIFAARRTYVSGGLIRLKDHVSSQKLKELNFNL